MNHSIEDLIKRINAMHDLAVKAHRVRNQYASGSGKSYDHEECKHLLEQVQSLAAGIAADKIGETIPTDMEYDKAVKELKGTRMDDNYYYFYPDAN
tara:strand:- start:214 stop:501 length:288 start_codon:yes stop_codon:yes gene_type:complete